MVSPLEVRRHRSDHQSSPRLEQLERQDAFFVYVSNNAYAFIWTAVALLYFANGCLCSAFAIIYYLLMTVRGGYYNDYVNGLRASALPVVIAAYTIAAIAFWSRFVFLVWGLVVTMFPAASKIGDFSSVKSRAPRLRRWVMELQHFATYVWSLDGLVSIDGPLFDSLVLLREVFEVIPQSYQVYKASTLILNPSINFVYVLILVLNCWLSPLIHSWAMHHKPGLATTELNRRAAVGRWLYLWIDVVLDLTNALVLPVIILWNIALVLLPAKPTVSYVFDIPMSDVAVVDILLCAKQLVITNWLDFISKILPLYSMLRYLDHVRLLTRRRAQPTTRLSIQRSPTSITPLPSRTLSKRTQSIRKKSEVLLVSRYRIRSPSRHQLARLYTPFLHKRVNPFINRIIVAWGLVVVVLHVTAHFVDQSSTPEVKLGCKASVRPWFLSKYACSVMEINCYRRNISGTAHEIDTVLASIAPTAVASLIITHCSAFEMPPRIRTLTNLAGLELTNVSIVSWGEEAALASPYHDSLHFLSVVRTNLTDIPIGMRSSVFPPHLRDMHIAVSNIATLPDDLHLQWSKMLNVYIEHSKLTSFPPTLALMHAERVSVLGNDIESIPTQVFTDSKFTTLSVARNSRLKRVPSTLGSLEALQFVILDGTNLTELPEALLSYYSGRVIEVSLGGTPLCINSLQHNDGDYSNAQQAIADGRQLSIVCRARSNEEIEAYALTQNWRDRKL